MIEERKRILTMLESKKISVDEAERLLRSLNEDKTTSQEKLTTPKHLFVKVNSKKDGTGDKVNIKLPIALLKSGIKITNLVSDELKVKVNSAISQKGMNFKIEDLNKENIDEFLKALTDFSIDVESESQEEVKIYCQ